MRPKIITACLFFFGAATTSQAAPKSDEICVYVTRYGEIMQAKSMLEIPRDSRASAQCRSAKENSFLAKPEDIKLSGNVREDQINSTLGQVHLRWPRSVEGLF